MDLEEGSSTAHAEDMTRLADLADQAGMQVLRPTPDLVFRQPDKTVKAIRRERAERERRAAPAFTGPSRVALALIYAAGRG